MRCAVDASITRVWSFFDQRDSFLRCGIRQAQEHDVRRIQKLSALLGIFALVLVDEQQLYVVAFAETLVDLKPVVPSLPSI